mmetsp:Transcript_13863/g.41876  ORF Transcript_13863/g.41876 Transcript_13863/m.41876 type:complete len:81 (+) Transcript_13863:1897-2139(+)
MLIRETGVKSFDPLAPHITRGCKDYCKMTESLLLPARAGTGIEHKCSSFLAPLEMLVKRSVGGIRAAARSPSLDHFQVLV